ncbi:hypothetical protein ACWC0A_38990 [Streptomyces scopuliridis]
MLSSTHPARRHGHYPAPHGRGAALTRPLLFKPEFRYSGAGFAYRITAAIGGGLLHFVALSLADAGRRLVPAGHIHDGDGRHS